jgi:hypothetical protein
VQFVEVALGQLVREGVGAAGRRQAGAHEDHAL